eukprot:SAG31_NODE_221_length_19918_cov_8.483829_11_plen_1299_part_00
MKMLQRVYKQLLAYKTKGPDGVDRFGKSFKDDYVFNYGTSSMERRSAHLVADFLGLDHRSHGSAAYRRVVVTDPQARREQVYTVGNMTIKLQRAKGLPLEEDGTAVYVVFSVNGTGRVQSRVTTGRNPAVWDPVETFDMKVPSTESVLEVAMFRHRLIGDEELIGVLLVPIDDLKNKVPTEKWFALSVADSEPTSEKSPRTTQPALELNLLYVRDAPAVGELTVTVKRAKQLPQMDLLGSADPFCMLELGKQTAQTRVVEDNLEPEWSESFVFKVEQLKGTVCTLKMYDFDSIGTNMPMGKVTFNISGLVPGREYEQWHVLEKIVGMDGPVQGSLLLAAKLDLGQLHDEKNASNSGLVSQDDEWDSIWSAALAPPSYAEPSTIRADIQQQSDDNHALRPEPETASVNADLSSVAKEEVKSTGEQIPRFSVATSAKSTAASNKAESATAADAEDESKMQQSDRQTIPHRDTGPTGRGTIESGSQSTTGDATAVETQMQSLVPKPDAAFDHFADKSTEVKTRTKFLGFPRVDSSYGSEHVAFVETASAHEKQAEAIEEAKQIDDGDKNNVALEAQLAVLHAQLALATKQAEIEASRLAAQKLAAATAQTKESYGAAVLTHPQSEDFQPSSEAAAPKHLTTNSPSEQFVSAVRQAPAEHMDANLLTQLELIRIPIGSSVGPATSGVESERDSSSEIDRQLQIIAQELGVSHTSSETVTRAVTSVDAVGQHASRGTLPSKVPLGIDSAERANPSSLRVPTRPLAMPRAPVSLPSSHAPINSYRDYVGHPAQRAPQRKTAAKVIGQHWPRRSKQASWGRVYESFMNGPAAETQSMPWETAPQRVGAVDGGWQYRADPAPPSNGKVMQKQIRAPTTGRGSAGGSVHVNQTESENIQDARMSQSSVPQLSALPTQSPWHHFLPRSFPPRNAKTGSTAHASHEPASQPSRWTPVAPAPATGQEGMNLQSRLRGGTDDGGTVTGPRQIGGSLRQYPVTGVVTKLELATAEAPLRPSLSLSPMLDGDESPVTDRSQRPHNALSATVRRGQKAADRTTNTRSRRKSVSFVDTDQIFGNRTSTDFNKTENVNDSGRSSSLRESVGNADHPELDGEKTDTEPRASNASRVAGRHGNPTSRRRGSSAGLVTAAGAVRVAPQPSMLPETRHLAAQLREMIDTAIGSNDLSAVDAVLHEVLQRVDALSSGSGEADSADHTAIKTELLGPLRALAEYKSRLVDARGPGARRGSQRRGSFFGHRRESSTYSPRLSPKIDAQRRRQSAVSVRGRQLPEGLEQDLHEIRVQVMVATSA